MALATANFLKKDTMLLRKSPPFAHRLLYALKALALVLLLGSLAACATQEAAAPESAVAVVPASAPVPDAAPVSSADSSAATVAPLPLPDFATCIPQLQQRARDAGVSAATVENVLAQVQYVPRVIELDRKQPEFSETFRNYLTLRVTDQRIAQGRKLLAQHRALLQQLERDYGVPPHYLLAFWGLETNYGSFLGKMPVLDSLATLACDPRRSEYFTLELLEALRLVDSGTVTPEKFIGSWAGAVGNMQFMPTNYRRYAVDADSSGKPDLWRSIPDAMTSAANYLNQIGWQKNRRWGREVRLPKNFDYAQASLQQRKSLQEWRALGVMLADGGALPAQDLQGAILVPSGHAGPAFIVYDNFDVIMKWNRSEFYAISVGHLADRIKGEGPLQRTPPDMPRLTLEQVKALQAALNAAGYAAGAEDGVLGSGTKKSLRAYQRANGMIADGYPAPEVFKALGVVYP